MIEILDTIAVNYPWIKDKCMFLTLHGSRAYGTNTKTSDYDFKGFLSCPKEFYFGSKHFEQVELKAPHPDTVIYDIRKFFSLAADCNPALIEVLFTDPSDHILVSSLGEEVLSHRK